MENSTCYLNPSWNNLVFERRNKAFGAYQLREGYHKNVALGLLVCASLTTFSFSLPTVLSLIGVNNSPTTKSNNDQGQIILKDPPAIIPITPPVKPKEPVVKVKNTNLVPIVTTKLVLDEPLSPIEPTFDETTNTNTGGETVIGIETTNVQPIITKPTEPYVSVEIMPAYEGGMEGLYSFLGNHLRYPSIDRRNGTEGTVYVQFVINEAGNVTNIKVIRGLSNTLDEEAKRVISLMKKWKPGIQNHEAVSVKMVVPIKFKLTS